MNDDESSVAARAQIHRDFEVTVRRKGDRPAPVSARTKSAASHLARRLCGEDFVVVAVRRV